MKIWRKRPLNEWMNDKAVCRTAPATPCLSKIGTTLQVFCQSHQFFLLKYLLFGMICMVFLWLGSATNVSMGIRPFQKGPLRGMFVGSVAFSDHMNIRNNFYEIIFSQFFFQNVQAGPPYFCYPPIIMAKIKVHQTMPIWVFRRAQRSGKLLEAWFRVSAKLSLDSRSKKPIADM